MFDKFFKKEKPVFVPKKYVMFNVDTFNQWFNDKDNGAVYAHEGIFLRLDKLSKSHITDYLLKCHNIVGNPYELYFNDIELFYEEIRKDWLEKLNK
jgi:hypothetical protein